MTRADIAAMLRSAQMNHLNQHITGLLLQVGDRFLHYLEGPKARIQETTAQLKADPRFTGLVVLNEGAIERRLYPHWSLAFQDVSLPSTRLGALNGALERAMSSDPVALAEGGAHAALLQRFWSEFAATLPR